MLIFPIYLFVVVWQVTDWPLGIDIGKWSALTNTHGGDVASELLECRTVLASITGFAFIDSDGSGVREPQEFGVSGVRVELRSETTELLSTAVTSDSGFYSFSNLPEGTYSVSARQPRAFMDGPESSGFAGTRISQDEIANIQLAASDIATEINFGETSIMTGYISPLWVLSSSGTASYGAMLRQMVVEAELTAGNVALAEQIREADAATLPVATMDDYETTAGDQLVVSSTLGLLQNDLAATGGDLSVELVTAPENGVLVLELDGSFSYHANGQFYWSRLIQLFG